MGSVKQHYDNQPEDHILSRESIEQIKNNPDIVGNWLDNLEKYLENVDNLNMERDTYW